MKHWATPCLLDNTAPVTNDTLSLSPHMNISRFKLLAKSNPPLSPRSAQWRRKLPALIRLIEAAHYRVSPTKEVYTDTTNLKERVRKLAMAFHNEMKKHGNRTFRVPSQEKMYRRLRTPPYIILSEEPALLARSARQA